MIHLCTPVISFKYEQIFEEKMPLFDHCTMASFGFFTSSNSDKQGNVTYSFLLPFISNSFWIVRGSLYEFQIKKIHWIIVLMNERIIWRLDCWIPCFACADTFNIIRWFPLLTCSTSICASIKKHRLRKKNMYERTKILHTNDNIDKIRWKEYNKKNYTAFNVFQLGLSLQWMNHHEHWTIPTYVRCCVFRTSLFIWVRPERARQRRKSNESRWKVNGKQAIFCVFPGSFW